MHRYLFFAAKTNKRLQVSQVVGVLAHGEVIGHQHRVEVELRQALNVHLRGVGAVSRDPDEADQTFFPRADERGKRAVVGHGLVPARFVREIVQLYQVHLLHAHALERLLQLPAGAVTGSLAGLGGKKVFRAVIGQEGGEPQLCISVAARHVDVVDARGAHHRQHVVRFLLSHGAQGRGAEYHSGGVVAGPAEGEALNHRMLLKGPFSVNCKPTPVCAGLHSARPCKGVRPSGASYRVATCCGGVT